MQTEIIQANNIDGSKYRILEIRSNSHSKFIPQKKVLFRWMNWDKLNRYGGNFTFNDINGAIDVIQKENGVKIIHKFERIRSTGER